MPGGHFVENVWQSDEHESGTAVGVDAKRKCAWKNHYSGHQGNNEIDDNDGKCTALQVLSFVDVRAIGNHNSHADTEREKGLSQCCEYGVGCEFRKVGIEKEGESVGRVFEGDGTNAQHNH